MTYYDEEDMDGILQTAYHLEEHVFLIQSWAFHRNIIEGSTPQAQCVKLGEEFGELCSGIAKGQEDVIVDSIGDMVVVLAIIAAQKGLDFSECVESAYRSIKDRKGRMVDGIFVKEESA